MLIRLSRLKHISRLLVAAFCITAFFGHYMPEVSADEAEDKDRVIVSFGDSYSSGEGNTPFYGQQDENKNELTIEQKAQSYDWLAHRSTLAWPGRLKLKGVDGTMADHHNENWFFVAASGATTDNMQWTQTKECIRFDGRRSLFKSINKVDLPAQLDIFDPESPAYKVDGKKVDYVTITMGGNDLDFPEVIRKMAFSTRLTNYSELDDKLEMMQTKLDFGLEKEKSVRDKLKEVYSLIHSKVGKDTTILVVGYPTLVDESNGIRPIFTAKEAKKINEKVMYFNKVLEEIVNEFPSDMNIKFVSVTEDNAFGQHGEHGIYSKEAWLNNVMMPARSEDLDVSNPVSFYSVHPDDTGSEMYAQCVQNTIDDLEKEKGITVAEKTEATDTGKTEAAEQGTQAVGRIDFPFTDRQLEMLACSLIHVRHNAEWFYKAGEDFGIVPGKMSDTDAVGTVLTSLTCRNTADVLGTADESYFSYPAADVCEMINMLAVNDITVEELPAAVKAWEEACEEKHGKLPYGHTKVEGDKVYSPKDEGPSPKTAAFASIDAKNYYDKYGDLYLYFNYGGSEFVYFVAHFYKDESGVYLGGLERADNE